MTREEAVKQLTINRPSSYTELREAIDMAIEALKPKPMQKFDNVKQHIDRLAGDYKCWDERLSHEEALELSRMLEKEPCEDCISRQAVIDKLNRLIEVERLQGTDEMGYGRERVSAYESMIFEIESEYLYPSVNPQQPCDDAISRQKAIDAMYALCDTEETLKENPWRDNPHMDAIIDEIENLPSVTPTHKEWIPVPEGATNKDMFKAVFGYKPAADAVVCNKEEWCGASEPCNYCIANPNAIGREEDWWNAPYKAESEEV